MNVTQILRYSLEKVARAPFLSMFWFTLDPIFMRSESSHIAHKLLLSVYNFLFPGKGVLTQSQRMWVLETAIKWWVTTGQTDFTQRNEENK